MGKVIKIETEDLVKKTKEGDAQAYEELIKIYEGDLSRIARSYLKNEEDIKDAVQLTFATAYFNINQLKDNKKFKNWIGTILINRCKKLNKTIAKRQEVSADEDEYKNLYVIDNAEEKINFENLIKGLSEREKEIFQMQYEEHMTTKEISKKLNMKENTIKSILSRGRLKLKRTIKPATIFMIILCVIATTVIAASIIKYIMGLFDTSSVGVDNDGILMAIEHMEWYQQVDMDYIDLDDGYKIKVDYILMDEMNLYMVVDLESEKDISEYDYITLPDIKITNEKEEVICDRGDVLNKQYAKVLGDKTIEDGKNHIKGLIYMYTDRFPISNVLNINLTSVVISKKSNFEDNKYIEIYANKNFQIELCDKFVNRNVVSYVSENEEIEKAIITETGFYAKIKANEIERKDIKLIDEVGREYKCYYSIINNKDKNNREGFIIANFNNTESKRLKLIIEEKEYQLVK